MIKVLIAEDSTTVRELLVALLNGAPDIEVIGEAKNGREAVEMCMALRPDIIAMDIQMPVMDGFEATKEIMIQQPTPIVIVSGHYDVREVEVSMQALRAGAVAVLPKPKGVDAPDFQELSDELIRTLKTLAHVKVVRHRRALKMPATPVPQIPPAEAGVKCAVVAIAVSTGGPAALHALLSVLPSDFPVPILVVQHMAKGFTEGLATWLNTASSLRVKIAEDREELAPQTVYLAPDDRHLGVNVRRLVELSDAAPVGAFRPAGTHLFKSVAKVFGASCVAVIMTGMGRDGVEGLHDVRAVGGRVVAQDEETSVVFGMPNAAIEAGVVNVVLPLAAIVAQLGNRVELNGPIL